MSGQPVRQRVGFLAPMGFDIADDEVASVFEFALRRFEHRVGFADAGAHAEKHLEPAAFFARGLALDGREQSVGIGAVGSFTNSA